MVLSLFMLVAGDVELIDDSWIQYIAAWQKPLLSLDQRRAFPKYCPVERPTNKITLSTQNGLGQTSKTKPYSTLSKTDNATTAGWWKFASMKWLRELNS